MMTVHDIDQKEETFSGNLNSSFNRNSSSQKLSDSNGIRTHNHLVCKRTLIRSFTLSASLAKWLSVRLQTK